MSKSKISFNVELRERVGTGGSRAARREGLVPGVLYGGGEDPVAISLKRNEVLKAIETGHFLSSTATLVHKGEKQMVIPQAIQMHPVSDQPMHVDLFRVSRDQKIKVEVQVHLASRRAARSTWCVTRSNFWFQPATFRNPWKQTFPSWKSATM